MIEEKSWEEFRSSGLLWWVNMLLHTFGWAIVIDLDKEKVVHAYPARVKFRGFSEDKNSFGYMAVSDYLAENIGEIQKESHE